MESSQTEKKNKAPTKKPLYASLRVRRETKRQIELALEQVNKKDFGRRIRADEFLCLALSLVTSQHTQELQEASLTHTDRLERDFRGYVAAHGSITRDEYLGKRLTGEIPAPPKYESPLTK